MLKLDKRYYLSTKLAEILCMLRDLHLLNLLSQASTVSGTWIRKVNTNE